MRGLVHNHVRAVEPVVVEVEVVDAVEVEAQGHEGEMYVAVGLDGRRQGTEGRIGGPVVAAGVRGRG